jgi:hypothetical protein
MKTNLLSISSFIAAIALLPVSTAAAGIAFVTVGILAVFAADYGRTLAPMGARAEIIPFSSNDRVSGRESLAA